MGKTLKDLPEDTDLQKIKIRLSEELYNSSSLPDYNIETRDVYLVGSVMGDFFVKVDKNSTQVYPMYNEMLGWDQLKNLEVIE